MAKRYPKAPVVTVDVTDEVIDASTRQDSSHCMIAEAVKLAYPEARRVSVDIQTIRFSDPTKGLRFTYLTPRAAQLALIDFDMGSKPAPFRIRLVRGHVTAAGRRRDGGAEAAEARKEQQQRTQAQREANAATGAKLQEMQQQPGNPPAVRFSDQVAGEAGLRERGSGNIPDRVGGRTPPTTPFSRRRQFGLRALERGSSVDLRGSAPDGS